MSLPIQPQRKLSEDDQFSPINPEALLISAYLEQGFFTPERHQIQPSDICSWGKLWQLLTTYQLNTGRAPSLDYVTKVFPEFTTTAGVSIDYAANLVLEAAAKRSLRTQLYSSVEALKQDDLAGAYAALDKLKRPVTKTLMPTDALDHGTVVDPFQVSKIPIPFGDLNKITGGIGQGELWLQAARFGHGKTWLMLMYATLAAQQGYSVGFHSLEMPANQVARRAHQLMCTSPATLALLRSPHLADHKLALDRIREEVPGRLSILDPSHGRINTIGSIASSCEQYDLVLVDHAGLLMTPDGHRATEGWAPMAMISNLLREVTLSSSTPILASAQINRAGESKGNKAPSASNLSLSDVLGQDADVVVTMSRLNSLVMVHSAEKVRNGPNLRWWSVFDPHGNRFHEITREDANELSLEADDLSYS